MPQLVALARLEYAGNRVAQMAPFSETAFSQNLRTLIGSARHAVFIAMRGGVIVGALAALTNLLFYSTKQFATEVWFYVSPDGKGAGVGLARRYLEWAKSLPGVAIVNLSVNLSDDSERTEQFYESIGLKRVGANYVLMEGS